MSPIFTSPIDSFAFDAVDGHVSALGELDLTDLENEHRDDLEYGIQADYDPANPEPLRIEAADLAVTGFAGVFDTDHVGVSVPPSWIAVCGTGDQPHVGLWRVKARCFCGASDTQVRLSWRSGDAPLAANAPVFPHVTDAEIELDLGLVNIIEMEGDHAWSGQVEVQGATTDEVLIGKLLFIPATVYARVRAPVTIEIPAAVAARDGFNQSAGALTGKTDEEGGTYVALANSDADDFTVNATDDTAERASVSDTGTLAGGSLPGRAVGLNLNLTDTAASVDFTLGGAGTIMAGLFARVVDASNFLFVRVAGTGVSIEAVLAGSLTGFGGSTTIEVDPSKTYTLTLIVAGTTYTAYLGPAGGPLEPVLAGALTELGTTLASGDVYLYDENSTASAATRTYDNFVAWVPQIDHAIHPSQSLRIDHQSAQRENAAGTRWGAVPRFEGARLKIPPSTRNDLIHRLVIKQDRNDLTQLPVTNASDQLSASLTVTPRVFLTNG